MKSQNLILAGILGLGGVLAVAITAATAGAALSGLSAQSSDQTSGDSSIRAAPAKGGLKGELSGFR